MTFKDRFPLEIEFDIDRERLVRHLLAQAKLGCFGLPLPFCLLFSWAFFRDSMAPYQTAGIWFWLGWFAIYLTAGLIACILLGALFYFSYFRPSAHLKAANLRLVVDGPFLRLVTGGFTLHDQRFHFRELSSYSTLQDPILRRRGMKSLSFRVQGRSTGPPISVTGLVDADHVRDVLCEIDAARELPT